MLIIRAISADMADPGASFYSTEGAMDLGIWITRRQRGEARAGQFR